MKRLPTSALALLALWFMAAPAQAQDEEDPEVSYGEAEYFNSCAVCHGLEGRGDGILAPDLNTPPTDLTALSARNGGAFPYWRVFATIDGRHVVPGHTERDMPLWGGEFVEQDQADFGPLGGELITAERIHQLTIYIQSLQR